MATLRNEILLTGTQTVLCRSKNKWSLGQVAQAEVLLELARFEQGCLSLQHASCVVWTYFAFIKVSESLQAIPITLLCNIQSRSANQRKDSMSLHTQMK